MFNSKKKKAQTKIEPTLPALKEAIYVIKTRSGKRLRWKFSESRSDSGYGRDMYVGVVNLASNELGNRHDLLVGLLDVRYEVVYDFKLTCEQYIKRYFGTNLDFFYEEV